VPPIGPLNSALSFLAFQAISLGMRVGWFELALVGCLIPACMPEVRPLSFKEALIPVMPGDNAAVTAGLKKGCVEMSTARDAPTAGDKSSSTAFKAAMGHDYECLPGIKDVDDVRRCAGEHQAQAVQIVGRKTETDDDRLLVAMLSVANAWAGGVANQVGAKGQYASTQTNQIALDNWAQDAVRTRTVALDLRFWRCPAARATPAKGELVWRRKSMFQLDLLQDGEVVGGNGEFQKLPGIVAAHPAALDFAKQAVAEQRSANTKINVGVVFAIAALAGDAVAAVGLVKSNLPLTIGGASGGVVFTTIAVPILFSSMNSLTRAQTSAMNAADSWNDEYVHGKNNLAPSVVPTEP
jgi:hypothetical protein